MYYDIGPFQLLLITIFKRKKKYWRIFVHELKKKKYKNLINFIQIVKKNLFFNNKNKDI